LHQLKNLLVNSLLNSVLDLLLNLHPENLVQSQSNQTLKKEYMTESNEIKNQSQQTPTKDMIDSFETTIAEKNKLIAKIQRDLENTAKIRAKAETEIDNLKLEKQSALDRAERAEARYLQKQEIQARSQAQEQNLLEVLFN